MTDSQSTERPHAVTLLWPALLVGGIVGALVATDALISHAPLSSHVFGTTLREVDYAVSAVVVLLALLAASSVVWRERVWRHRTAAVVGLVMLTSHFTALAVGPISPLTFAILLAVGVWLLDLLAGEAPLRPSAFRTATVLFFACALASAIGAHPTEVLVGILALLTKLTLAIALAELLDDTAKVRFAVHALLWAAGLLALVGLAQVGIYWLFDLVLTLAETDYRFAATPFGALLRATGFSRTANQYAPPIGVACAMCALLAVAIPGVWRRAAYALLALLTAAAVALSIVRGTWLATAAGLLLVPFLASPRLTSLWVLLALAAGIVALTSGLVSWMVETLLPLFETGVSERIELMGAGLAAMFGALNGTGVDNFGPASPTLERYPVHNAPIQAGSELGLPGLIVFVALLTWIGWRLWRARRSSSGAQGALINALFIGYVVLVIAVQTEPMAYSQFLWIYLGLSEAAARTAEQHRPAHA